MHKGVILLVKAEDADEAKRKADTFLEPFQENVWDWYQFGGRWTGALTGYRPDQDPKNQTRCDICKGTGKRKKWPKGTSKAQIQATHGCNGCNGTGKTTKWPTDWDTYTEDILPLTDPRAAIKVAEWSDGWGKNETKRVKMLRKQFKGNRDMLEYLKSKQRGIDEDQFTFDSNVFDTEEKTNRPPVNPVGYWAVVVDMHS